MEQETQPVAESAAAGTAVGVVTDGSEHKNEDREPPPPQLSLLKIHNNAHEVPPRLVRDRSTEMRSLFPPRPSLMPPQLDRYRSDSSLTLTLTQPQLDRFRSLDSSMMPPQLERYRSDSSPVEPRMSVCSTSGMVYESVVVVGHMFGSDNVVYYLLEVRSWEMPLEGYVIRRRYSDFKKFHQELSKHMPGNKPRSSSLGLEYAFSSLLCNPLSNSQPEMSSDWSPKRRSSDGSSTRKNTRGSSGDDLDPLASPTDHIPLQYEDDTRSSIPSTPAGWVGPPGSPLPQTATLEYSVPSTAKPGMTYYDSNLTLPLDSVKFNMSERAILPDMPTGGVSSIFSTRQMLIKYRVEQFNKILAAVMSDNSSDVANVLMNFIQEKPGGQVTSYTSLSEYAAIDMPWKVERYARRRAMSMGRRPPTLFRDSSSSSTTSIITVAAAQSSVA